MTEFLEEWISTRLGVSIEFSNIGKEFFDGKLFFKILQSYDVAGPEVKEYFCRANTEEEALRNLNLLRVSFKLLGVLRNDNVLEEISRKNGAAVVDLLNQLYLRLSNKHALPLITEAKKMQVLRQETGRFKVSKVLEKKCKLPLTKRPEEKLLARIKASIQVFEMDSGDDVDISKKSSRERLKEVSKKAREEIEMKIIECKCGATVEDCLMKFDERLEQLAGGDKTSSTCPPDEYVKMLKLRTMKQLADKEMESRLKDIIVKKIWCKQMEQREEEFRCSLAEKLLKQSNYEREMAQRLGKVHLHHKIISEKRRQLHEQAQRIYTQRLETIEWRKDSSIDRQKKREKRRLQNLHRKLYSEKVTKARNDRLEMIKDTVYDLVDFALKMVLFKSENAVAISQRKLKDWKILFFKSLPLLPKAQEMRTESIVDECSYEHSFDGFIEAEEEAEEVLVENALNEYLILLGPWTKELWPESENFEEDMRVLGFAVHRLLEFKYPLPPPPEPADVFMYPVRVILNNFDVKKIKILKSLLVKPGIEIIDLPGLIKNSIVYYKKEVGLDKKKDKKKSANVADKKEKKKKIAEEPKFKDVEIQCPSLLDLEPKLSRLAELGKNAFEILGRGSTLTEDLIVDIVIEFVRNLTERQGWVLLNFPSDCRQVYHLECKFTGLEAPIKCVLESVMDETNGGNSVRESKMGTDERNEDLVSEVLSEHTPEESEYTLAELNNLRSSRLVPRPNPPTPNILFNSYFTHFIQLEMRNKLKSEMKKASVEISKEEALTEESSLVEQTPQSFYKNMDIYLNFDYNKLNLSTLKRLARAILDETDEPGPERKTSVELFGDVAKEKKGKKGEKTPKTKSAKQPPSEILTEETDSPEGEFAYLEEMTRKEKSIPCQVAEPCWEFTSLDISEENKLALASFWENIEFVYIHNLMAQFAFFREHDASLLPYRNLILKKLATIIEEPDQRQDLVNDLLVYMNNIDDVLRGHGDVKKEIFCRIFELQQELWELCDIKKTMCEAERINIIKENWVPKHLCEMFNIYVTMMETEVDRFTDSIQFLNSYYILSLGKPFPSSKIDKWSLPRYKVSEFEPDDAGTLESDIVNTNERNSFSLRTSRKSTETKRELDVTLTTEGIPEIFYLMLSNPDYDEECANPLLENINETVNDEEYLNPLLGDVNEVVNEEEWVNPLLENINVIVNKTVTDITALANNQFNIIEKERKQLSSPKNPKSRAATTTKKSTTVSKLGKEISDAASESVEHEEETKKRDNYFKALVEWAKAVRDELERTIFRLNLIKNRFINDFNELKCLMIETFYGLYNEIISRYFHQTSDCDNLLHVLMSSVEAETPIQYRLVLTLDNFYTEPQIKPLSCGPPPPVTPIQEIGEDFTFTIQQLKKFAEKMMSVAPLGISVESLIAVIEDMLLTGKENGYPYLPKGWILLNRSHIRKAIQAIFGDIVVVDWKDLLIFGLEFRFPSLSEIIEARDQFMAFDPLRTETVKEADFKNIRLWFEQELCDSLGGDLKVVLGKQFLFDLYRVDSHSMNYTAFLLNYCKDENAIEGFGKALALATGYGYVLSEENLHLLLAASEKKESILIAEQIINILLQDTLNRAEGIVITEVDDDGNPIMNEEEEFVKTDFGFFHSEKILEKRITYDSQARALESNKMQKSQSSIKVEGEKKTSSVPESVLKYTHSIHSRTSARDSKNMSQTLKDFSFMERNIVWKSWLPKAMVKSLLMTSFLCYALPEEQFHLQTQLEEQINRLYWMKGTRDCIEAHVLAQSVFIRELFSKCYKYQSRDVGQLIKSIVDSNRLSSLPLQV